MVAGNRRLFERAMKRAVEHVERHEWSKAVEQYEQAVAEFPDDAAALIGLGLAYINTQQPEKALPAYQQARRAGAEGPALLERLADVLERLRRLDEAADTYVALADHALQERDIERAIHFWKRATQLAPDHPIARLNLAKAYASQDRTRQAIKEYLALANAFHRAGRPDQAMNICQQALMLDPRNNEVLSLMSTLRNLLEPAEKPEPARKPVSLAALDDLSFEDEPLPSSQRYEGSPVDIARQHALGALAEAAFEEDLVPATTSHQIATLIGQALDFQRQKLVDNAAATYEQLLRTGLDRPEVRFNLGLLCQEKQQWREAIHHLSAAQGHADYRLGALFAVGECYRAQGKIDQALAHLLEVLKQIDLTTVQEERASELIQLYDSLANSYARKGDPEQARSLTDSIIRFLSSKEWEDRVKEARQQLDKMTSEGVVMSLAEIVGVPGSEKIMKSMAAIHDLVGQGKIFTAIEESYEAIRVTPFYLPLHLGLGEVFLNQGHFEEATAKFLAVAHVYQVRGDTRAAIGAYRRLLRASPMAVTVRTRLIDLLINLGTTDEALREYLALGKAYFELAQVNKALEIYNEALRLTPRTSDETAWTVELLHHIGDIYLQRADWRQALKIYQRIRQISPYDERTCLNLVDLHYKMGRPREGLAELDAVVGHFYKEQKFSQVLTVLQDAVQMRPEEEALRFRLAQAYLSQGKKEKAVAELDMLGDLQLKAGRTQQAIETIRSIVKINPPNVESYRQLLQQLGQRL
jgi:tetratricopeptide (TPR) repeat protein